MKMVAIQRVAARTVAVVLLLAAWSGCDKDPGCVLGEAPLPAEAITLQIKYHGFDIEKGNGRISMIFRNTGKVVQQFQEVKEDSMGIVYINWYRRRDGKRFTGEEPNGKDTNTSCMVLKPGGEYRFETEGWEKGNGRFLYAELEPGAYYLQVDYCYAIPSQSRMEAHEIYSNVIKVEVDPETQAKIRKQYPGYFPQKSMEKK